MLQYPQIDPIIFGVGPLQVRWYGLMYVLGFTASYLLVRHQIRKFNLKDFAPHLDNLNLVLIIGLVAGARLGYAVFYNGAYYLRHPLEVLATWQGGMSFHGGLIGLIVGGWIYCRRNRLDFWQAADLYVVTAPIGICLGRLGNFINAELFGRVSEVPWAMVFPYGGPLPRHPSQLYEAFLEGALLFAILWPLKNRQWKSGTMLAVFLVLYGILRGIAELFREPDAHLGFLLGPLTMGQILSAVMIVTGAVIYVLRRSKPEPA